MDFNDYQASARSTAIYPREGNILEIALNTLHLGGASGTIAERIKKAIRDDSGTISSKNKSIIDVQLPEIAYTILNIQSNVYTNEVAQDMEPRFLGLMYATLGLVGEAGEIASKVEELIGDGNQYDPNSKTALAAELGDVLWYISAVCDELGVSMADVAEANVAKLARRKAENMLHGDGDTRTAPPELSS